MLRGSYRELGDALSMGIGGWAKQVLGGWELVEGGLGVGGFETFQV